MQLVGIAWRRAELFEHGGHGVGIERSHLVRRRGQAVGPQLAQAAAQRQRPRPALLERRVVEVGVGASAQDRMGQRRGLRRLDGVHLDRARLDLGPEVDEALDVEALVQAVVDGLARQHVVGHRDRAGRRVLLARGQPGPHRGHEVVGLHPLEVDRAALAPVHARHDERAGQVPAPARAEHRVQQHGLGQGLGRLRARQHRLHPGQREAVLGPEREDDRVVVRRRLQLEVEGDAEALAQRQAEGAVDAPAERRVDDELRAFAFVEAALDDDALLGRQVAQGVEAGGEIRHHLLGHLGRDPGALAHQAARALAVTGAQHRLERGAQLADRFGELGRAGRCLAEPERDGRREVPGVVHADRADLHLGHAPRVRPQQEDVARRRLDGEVLVHRADGHAFGVEHDAVVAGLGDGAAAGQGGQARATARPQPAVDGIVVQVRPAPPPPGLDPPAGQRHDLVEVLPRQLCVRCGAPRHGPDGLHLALAGGGDLRDHLLGEHVERGDGRREQVEAAGPHRGQQRRALDQLVTRRGVEPSGRRPVAVVVRPPHALEEGADGAR